MQDYDFENTSPYGTLDQVYASAFNTWQIEQVCTLPMGWSCENLQPWPIRKANSSIHAARCARYLLCMGSKLGVAERGGSNRLWH